MKIKLRCLLINAVLSMLVMSCGRGNVPLLAKSEVIVVNQDEYLTEVESIVTQTMDNVQRNQAKSNPDEFSLDTQVIGLSLEVRSGLFGWNITHAQGIELHFNQQGEQ